LTAVRREPPAGTPGRGAATLAAGRVGRPHGLDGSFYVTGARARLLREGATVTVAGRELELTRLAGTEQRPLVRVAGVDDRDAAEALRGSELLVASADAPSLQEGEWWAHELEGCSVTDGDRTLGTVRRLIELPSCEALEVAPSAGGAPVLVPMVSAAIRAVDPARRHIDVDVEFLGDAGAALTPAKEGGR
jgi:16S rRNA processing protein RimM